MSDYEVAISNYDKIKALETKLLKINEFNKEFSKKLSVLYNNLLELDYEEIYQDDIDFIVEFIEENKEIS